MDDRRVFDVLNELLAAEAASLLPRMTECTAFVRPAETARLEAVKRMASEHQANTARLARTLLDLGGQPRPHSRDMHSANLHYLELDVLLPQAVASEEKLSAKYAAALRSLSEWPAAAAAVRDIGSWHRVCADYLRSLATTATAPAG
jgi:hypothetical protein